jgi:hypothetical protein
VWLCSDFGAGLAVLSHAGKDSAMPMFRMPLSGNVTQGFNFFTPFFSPSGGIYSLINVNMGRSSAPDIEAAILEDVGSYGRQLGKIGDALAIIIRKLEPELDLKGKDKDTIEDLKAMLRQIDEIKHAKRVS